MLPPWLILASLLGVITAAAVFLLIGRYPTRVTWYALLGLFASSLGQVVGSAVSAPNPLSIGDVNLMTACLAACLVVGAARAWGL